MENKLYLVGIKCSLEELANHFGLVDSLSGEEEIAYFNFWNNIAFIEYNQDTYKYTVKEFVDDEVRYYTYDQEKELFQHMDDYGIEFIYDNNPMGDIFQSYSAAYLAVVRWVADVAWARDLYYNLLEG
jgi:hypothetical protein